MNFGLSVFLTELIEAFNKGAETVVELLFGKSDDPLAKRLNALVQLVYLQQVAEAAFSEFHQNGPVFEPIQEAVDVAELQGGGEEVVFQHQR